MPTRSNSRRVTTVRKHQRKTATVKPKFLASELRDQLGDFKKEVRIPITEAALQGTFAEVERRLTDLAKTGDFGFDDEWEIGKRPPIKRNRYSSNESRWFLIGYRPYTDEVLEQEGAKLLKKKEAQDKRNKAKRAKEVLAYNNLAAKLGKPLIKE